MPYDPRLDNILRALVQPWHPETTATDTSRLYASAAAVLTTLTNPLNVTLLTTQILTAPAIWSTPDSLRASLRVFGTFQSATLGKMEMEVAGKAGAIGVQEWIGVVVRGANHNVPRWKHLLLLGGVLSAIREGKGEEGGGGYSYLIPRVTKRSLEDAFCRAVNLSLVNNRSKDLESDVLSLILSHSIQGLSQRAKQLIDYDALLPVVVRSIYYSGEGFQSGYFLSKIDNDVVSKDGKMAWPSKSNSLLELQQRLSRPLFTSMSGIARLAGIAVKEARDVRAVHALLDRLSEFSQTLVTQWKMNRLSQVSMVDEPDLIDIDSRKQTIPVVWQILKMVLFTTILVLQELATRLIQSPEMADVRNGPVIAAKILHILRGFYFITARLGPSAFTSYNFVYMTSIDILTLHEKDTEKFVLSIAPANVGTIPDILMTRILDLYFLNTVEHLIPHLPPSVIEDLIVPSCVPYLATTCNKNLHALFEAAHSVMLAVIARPILPTDTAAAQQMIEGVLPFYTEMIFKSFPEGLSRRQFRLAFSTLVKVCEAPGRKGGDLVMEMGWERAKKAREEIMILALVDSLPAMSPETLSRWLTPVAELIAQDISDATAKSRLRARFWEALSGEMDVERAEIAVRWVGRGRGGGGPKVCVIDTLDVTW
ncbi:hypothetical protein DFH27DRAFT_643218 [Peziza echinospora]|nr:hypothetical protein DFH27DRAFT_643218 [Peziza echinospora]